MEWREHIARNGTALIPGEPWARKALLAVLVLAAVLRFWDLPRLPYTHDELSALVRIYPSLWETMRKGVMDLDTHPPAVQAFEWLWTRLFSMEEADVKLPFILMSLASIVMLYRFATAWTSESAALVLATLMATLQYSVFYGQIARPYAAGLFTTALMADQLTRWLAFGNRRMLAGIGIAAVLSAATHHFSLLLAALMAVAGLLLSEKQHRRPYIVMCLIAIVLYLPIVPITLHQLSQGGLQGWLPPPGDGWLTDYGRYIAHWSSALAGLLLAAIGASVWLTVKHGGAPKPIRWAWLLWGTAPLLIGYAYSVLRAPVLQYSMLLFSLPYLLLLALHGLMHLKRGAALVSCALLGMVSVHSLVNERKHYTVTYHSKYEAMLREGITATQEHGRDRVLVLLEAPGHMIDFYRRLWRMPDTALRTVNVLDWPQAKVDSLLHAERASILVHGRSNGSADEHVALIQQRFPRLMKRIDMPEGQVRHFTKEPKGTELFDRDTISHLSHGIVLGPWSIEPTMPHTERGWEYSGRDFGLLIEVMLDTAVSHHDDLIEVVAVVDGFTSISRAAIIADVRSGDSTVFYRGGNLDPVQRPDSSASMIVTISPSQVRQSGALTLRAYVHNQNKEQLRVRSITVLRRDANRIGGAVLGPAHWLGRFPPE